MPVDGWTQHNLEILTKSVEKLHDEVSTLKSRVRRLENEIDEMKSSNWPWSEPR